MSDRGAPGTFFLGNAAIAFYQTLLPMAPGTRTAGATRVRATDQNRYDGYQGRYPARIIEAGRVKAGSLGAARSSAYHARRIGEKQISCS